MAADPPLQRFDEAYRIDRTVEVCCGHERYRVEIVQDLTPGRPRLLYRARYWHLDEIEFRTPTAGRERRRIRVAASFAWVDRAGVDADGALREALSWLAQQAGRY